MTAVDELLPWMPGLIKRHLSGEFGQDWTDDDIVERVEQLYRRPDRPVSARDHRLIVAAVAEIRRTAFADVTLEAVSAERDRRKAAGEPSGYDALATHFHCDASTIRRRLGVLDSK